MKRRRLSLLFVISLLAVTNKTLGQNLNSAYFLDGYTYGHQMNPAKDYDRKGYVSFPGLGHIKAGIYGNLNLNDILYQNPFGDGVTTFLNPDLSTEEVMSKFNKNNKMLSEVHLEVLGFGFKAFNGFNTFNIGVRTNAGIIAPYELFDVMKNLQQQNYEVGKFKGTATGWVEVGMGHSHQLNDAWRVGGKFKLLLGAASARVNARSLNLDLSSRERWTAIVDADVDISMKGLTWGDKQLKRHSPEYMKEHPNSPATYEQVDFEEMELDNSGVGGAGFAIDFGTEWDLGKQGLLDGLKLSASLLDLGFIRWKNTLRASNTGEPFVFDGYDEETYYAGGQMVDAEWENLGERLEDLYQLKDDGTTKKAHPLGATLNIGVEYALPSYDKLRFGLLSTTRIQGSFSWNEERLSVNLSPAKAFEMALSGAVGTLGASVGGVINIHPRGFNLFLGLDHMLGKLAKKGYPKKNNTDVTIGLNIPFGKVKDN
ncbi:MAG: hypothetical protein J6Y04_06490 [Bacteroidaceae bacterium]|nr:hypothetical protein [Bacteroidaceae bacterium]